jgi:hypothetical protein
MAAWNCHPHPKVRHWVIERTREGRPGMLQSFDAACKYAEDDVNWGNRSADYAYVDYLPGRDPFTFPMILKIRIEPPYATVVGVAFKKPKLGFTVE